MAMDGEMGNEMEDSVTDQNQKETEKNNTKPEDLDGLQMLRLPQEDDKSLLRKDILPVESIEQLEENVNECFKIEKLDVDVEPKVDIVTEEVEQKPSIEQVRKIALKHKGVDGAVKPALVKKEVSELHGLTERQQKILQDFHVKFVLEGVNVEEDDESRARKHSEFVELKKRLEEEEKMYAGCALGEPSDDGTDIKDQREYEGETIGEPSIDVKPSIPVTTARNVTTPALNVAEDEDIDSSSDAAVRATMDGVINSLAEVAICRPSLDEDVKPQLRPQNVRNAMKGLADDDDGLSELQEYTNREGSVGWQCCCRKAGKQIDEGDESDVYMTHSSYSVLNVVCPVSGMPVVDLEDPVRSEECEHIYDRSSALNYIASMVKDGFCLCASPGCRALLAENKLVTDSRLWQDIEELRQIKAAMWESRMLQDLVNIDDSDDD